MISTDRKIFPNVFEIKRSLYKCYFWWFCS